MLVCIIERMNKTNLVHATRFIIMNVVLYNEYDFSLPDTSLKYKNGKALKKKPRDS